RVEKPFPVLLHDRNRKREFIITHYQNSLVRSFLACLDRHLLFCLVCKFRRSLFVHHGVFGTDEIFAVWTENFLCCSSIKICRDLDQSLRGLFRRIELLLPWLRCSLRFLLFRGRLLLLWRCDRACREEARQKDNRGRSNDFR